MISSQKLNKLEQGVADAGGGGSGNLVVHITKTVVSEEQNDYATDKTAGEIKAALQAGQSVGIPFSVTDDGVTVYGVALVGANDVTFLDLGQDGFNLQVQPYVAGATDELTMTAETDSDYFTASEGGK